MASSRDTKLQQSQQAGAGRWQLAPGRALSLYPRGDGLLRITRGRAWVTLDLRSGAHPDQAGDHCLGAGEQLRVSAGRHLVFESLDPVPLDFEWVPAPATASLPLAPRAVPLVQAGRAWWRLLCGLLGTLPWLLSGGLRGRQR